MSGPGIASAAVVGSADREIVTVRLIEAPRELVFRAWVDPEQVGQWWGPTGFTTTLQEMDVRVVGRWRLIMHGPDGTDFHNHSIFTEVTPPGRLAYDHISGPKFHALVTFEEAGAATRLTLRMTFPSREERDQTVETFGAIEGARQTLARLETFLWERRST